MSAKRYLYADNDIRRILLPNKRFKLVRGLIIQLAKKEPSSPYFNRRIIGKRTDVSTPERRKLPPKISVFMLMDN